MTSGWMESNMVIFVLPYIRNCQMFSLKTLGLTWRKRRLRSTSYNSDMAAGTKLEKLEKLKSENKNIKILKQI